MGAYVETNENVPLGVVDLRLEPLANKTTKIV
jgi:hypothetical protein